MANKLYNRNAVFIAACIGMCLFGISMVTVGSILPEIASTLHFNNMQSAALVTFIPVGMLAGSLLFGPVIDRYGYKYMLIAGCLSVVLGFFGLSYFKSLALLQTTIALIGFGGGILNGETNALVADISDENKKASNMSFLGIFYGVGAVCIPLLISFLSAKHNYNEILQYFGTFMLLCVIFCAAVKYPQPKQAQGFSLKDSFNFLKTGILPLFCLILFFEGGIESVSNNWLTTYFTQNTELTKSEGLQALTFLILGMTAARIFLVFLCKKFNPFMALRISLLLATIGFVILTDSPGPVHVYVSMLLAGIGLAATYPVILGGIGSSYSAISGTAIGIALTVGLVGQMLLNLFTGILTDSMGIQMFPYLIISCIVIMLVLVTALKENK